MSEYCLRWNNHRPNLVTVFSELLTSEALVDVTLATDGHYIHAHKLVLSACSVYFKDLFGANPCKHPIVILKDIRIDDLKTVIDFIYRGEVNVAQDRLQDVLKTAESLRIKGLAENPRNYDEIPCQSTRFTSSALGPQVARQRSSLTDSREQSLSLEGEEDGEPGTPPSSKRRKITSSHDSSESQHDEQENDNTNRVLNVKDEPVDDRENDKSHSGDTEQESNVNRVADAMLMLQGASQDSGEDSGNAAGTSSDATLSSSHSQGRGKRGVLQRQHGINTGAEERRDEASIQQLELNKTEVKIERKPESDKVPELIVPDTMALGGGTVTLTTSQSTLLQVPAMVVGPRDSLGLCTLPKQHSNPTPLLALTPSTINKQSSHPEVRVPPKQQGPPPMIKQQSYPSVLTHAPSHSVERIPSTTSSGSSVNAGAQQHLQVIPMQVFMKQQRQLSTPTPSVSSPLRPIQPKPSTENQASEPPPKKEIPLIRLTPSEDSGSVNLSSSSSFNVGTCGPTGLARLARAVSEEPAMTRPSIAHTPELLAPGPSALVQSVSQDSGLDGGLGRRMPSVPQVAATAPAPIRQASTPGHCPVLRGGPALGCNFCWNSTDPQGRVLRRKTKYHCPECRTNLCIVPCFHEYHKQMERAQDTEKQITKILTKTSSM
ncbi:histone-lysine N-methyltransferase SETD1B-like [Macrobrachium rosenbergii]|uniref:histone-lysine N-methyltransferase SETD1B-like n=1 Tax=Macrobrachium rosenbergii TaxID=79674 RepID=UPI0034D5FA09